MTILSWDIEGKNARISELVNELTKELFDTANSIPSLPTHKMIALFFSTMGVIEHLAGSVRESTLVYMGESSKTMFKDMSEEAQNRILQKYIDEGLDIPDAFKVIIEERERQKLGDLIGDEEER